MSSLSEFLVRAFRTLFAISPWLGVSASAPILLGFPMQLYGQESESLSGVIFDDYSGAPLRGVRVEVVGKARAIQTDRQGRFRLDGVPLEGAVVRLEREGYVTEVHTLSPDASAMAPMELRMVPLAVVLQALNVVTDPPPPHREERELTSGTRTRITEAELRNTSGNVADLLRGRVNGVQIGTSQLGRVAAVRVRGSSSITGGNNPLIFLDGVRVDGMSAPMRVLEQISLNEVSSVEILRGPEAMAYGLGSGSGVIIIRTRSGDVAPDAP